MFALNIYKMNIQTQKIPVRRTGVYFQAGDLERAEVVWFVGHGYGQLGDRLIRKFDHFVDRGHAVISVEGLNRFYWQGVSGTPAATWMTSRFRLDEIRDNNAYLSQTYQLINPEAKIVLLGFSQGGTTFWRWIHEMKPDFHTFINYAGWMPEDIELASLKSHLKNKNLVFTYGSRDEYLTAERIKAFEEIATLSTLDVNIHRTNGEHRVDREVLKTLFKQYVQ